LGAKPSLTLGLKRVLIKGITPRRGEVKNPCQKGLKALFGGNVKVKPLKEPE